MPDYLKFHTLDVFTDTPYAGNPLAVVLGADGLNTAQMQTMAREINLSETIFVMAPRDPANTARVRIFFPTAEIPFAGHPTLGCAALLATMGEADGDFDRRIVLEEEAGLVPVTVSRRNGCIHGELNAPVLPFAHDGAAPADLIARALGLSPGQIGFGAHTPGLYQGGRAYLYAPVPDLAALAAARPIEPYWSDLMAVANTDSVYLYSPDGEGRFRARMFAPTDGVPEDPATGSATAILAAQLLAAGALAEGETRWRLTQGVEMGRPSQLGLTIRTEGGQLREVRVSGSAVAISRGEVTLPATSE